MRHRIEVALRANTQQRATQQAAWLTSYLSTSPAVVVYDVAVVDSDGWMVTLDVTFDLTGDADAMWADVVTYWQKTGAILPGSWIRRHRCRHDEGQPLCVIEAEVVK